MVASDGAVSTAVVDEVGDARRTPGRPRSADADRAIVDATLTLLIEVGLGALSIEEVATRAGVSKATIYRRFPNKDALIVESLACMLDTSPPPTIQDDISTRDILVRMISGMRQWYRESPNGALMPRMLGYARTNPELFGCFYDRVLAPRRENLKQVLIRGIERGEVRRDIDLDLAVTMIIAPTFFTATVGMGGRDVTPGSGPTDFVDAVLRGLAPSQ